MIKLVNIFVNVQHKLRKRQHEQSHHLHKKRILLLVLFISWLLSVRLQKAIFKKINLSSSYSTVREEYIQVDMPHEPTHIEKQKKAKAKLQQVLQDNEKFFCGEYGLGTLTEYCKNEQRGLDLNVEITQYTFVDLDGDNIQEVIVALCTGEKNQVSYIVLKYEDTYSYVNGAVFADREIMNLKEDGTFIDFTRNATASWSKMQWDKVNGKWLITSTDNGSMKRDALWLSYSAIACTQ